MAGTTLRVAALLSIACAARAAVTVTVTAGAASTHCSDLDLARESDGVASFWSEVQQCGACAAAVGCGEEREEARRVRARPARPTHTRRARALSPQERKNIAFRARARIRSSVKLP
jgi:hypothetical protein